MPSLQHTLRKRKEDAKENTYFNTSYTKLVLSIDAGRSCPARGLWQCHYYRINGGTYADHQHVCWQHAYYRQCERLRQHDTHDGSVYADNNYFWPYKEGHHHDR